MKRALLAAVLTLLISPAGALAGDVNTRDLSPFRASVVKLRAEVDRKLGHRAGGRDILKYGVEGRDGKVRPARHAKVVRYRDTLRHLIAPPAPVPAPLPAAAASTGTPAQTSAPVSGGSSSGAASVRGPGGYCGVLQFDQQTWQSVGGSGSPCGASVEEQFKRGEILRSQRGTSPWPVCGSRGSLREIARCESGYGG